MTAGQSVGAVWVDVLPSANKFAPAMRAEMAAASKSAQTAGAQAGKSYGAGMAASIKNLVGPAVAVIGAAQVASFFKDSFGEAQEAQKVGKQTAAVLRSTGAAANVTAGQISKLAGAISSKVGIDDEAIQSGENMLLTFTNIRNEVGKGNDIFDQATKIMVDMSVATGTDMKSASIQLGKALNDPIKGISALTRVGVSFTDQQKAQIKSLVESGRTMEAQKIILKELRKEFGGSAAAQATDLDKLNVKWGNFKEQIGTAITPAVNTLINFLSKTLDVITSLPGPVQAAAAGFIALKVAMKFGAAEKLSAVFTGVSGALDTMRLKTMYATEAFTAARASGATPFAASLTGVKTAATGTGAALKTKLAAGFSAVGGAGTALLVGVPLIIGGIERIQDAIVKSYPGVERLTGGLIDLANGDYTNVASKNFVNLGESIHRLADPGTFTHLGDMIGGVFNIDSKSMREATDQVGALDDSLTNLVQSKGPKAARLAFQNLAKQQGLSAGQTRDLLSLLPHYKDALAGAANENKKVTGTTDDYTDAQKDATSAVEARIRSENKLRNQMLASRDALIGYKQQEADTRKELAQGRKTLNLNTQAGRDNQQAILDQIAAYNDMTPKQKKAAGGYREIRKTLLDQLGPYFKSRDAAKKYIDKFLEVPGAADKAKGHTKDYADLTREKWREINKLKAHPSVDGHWSINKSSNGISVSSVVGGSYTEHVKGGKFAAGGHVTGPGTATSDSILARLSNGEFIQRAAAVKREGVAAMKALNEGRATIVPKFADGGLVMKQDLSALFNGVRATKNSMSSLFSSLSHGMVGLLSSKLGALVNFLSSRASAMLMGGGSLASIPKGPIVSMLKSAAANWGWSAYIPSLLQLVAHESGFNPSAQNPTSTAYGLFQFLDSTWGGTGIGKTSDPRLQTLAGFRYIRSRYGNPGNAWAFWQAHQWYDNGGILPSGTLGINSSGRPERVLDPRQTENFERLTRALDSGALRPVAGGGGGSRRTRVMTPVRIVVDGHSMRGYVESVAEDVVDDAFDHHERTR